jgi:hypothetical protein
MEAARAREGVAEGEPLGVGAPAVGDNPALPLGVEVAAPREGVAPPRGEGLVVVVREGEGDALGEREREGVPLLLPVEEWEGDAQEDEEEVTEATAVGRACALPDCVRLDVTVALRVRVGEPLREGEGEKDTQVDAVRLSEGDDDTEELKEPLVDS